MKPKILISENMTAEVVPYLESFGYEVKFGSSIEEDVLIEDLQGCSAIIVRLAKITDKIFANCPDLKVVAKHGVGYDNIDIEAAKRHGRRVVFTPHANANSVAEHAMALIMSCAKEIPNMAVRYKAEGFNVKNEAKICELGDKTLGLLGYGKIGSSVARMAIHGFGMNVLVFDPFLPASFSAEGVKVATSREELFSDSDFISIHMPATPETINSVSTAEFKLMKNTAFIINTARGAIIDTDAIIAALDAGEIGGAALDVTEPEPMPADSRLFDFPQVIMTPHIAGGSNKAMSRMATDAAQGIHEVLSGSKVTWAVV